MRIFGNRKLSPENHINGGPSPAPIRDTLLPPAAKKKAWLASLALIFIFSLIGAGVSGCRGPWVHAKVFIGNGGELYLDIPKAKEHKHAVLYDISIVRVDSSGHASGTYWSSTKSGHSSNVDVTVFPLPYGDNIRGLVTEDPAKNLINGTYVIRGFVKFFDSDELEAVGARFEPAYVAGRFEYENGVVRNLAYQ